MGLEQVTKISQMNGSTTYVSHSMTACEEDLRVNKKIIGVMIGDFMLIVIVIWSVGEWTNKCGLYISLFEDNAVHVDPLIVHV